MLRHAFAVMLAYIIGTGALVYANTVWVRLGDRKFEGDGWQLYWPLWSAFYFPPTLVAIIVAGRSQLPAQTKVCFAWIALLAILVVMEISFLFDIHLPALLVEWMIMVFAIFAAKECLTKRSSQMRGSL